MYLFFSNRNRSNVNPPFSGIWTGASQAQRYVLSPYQSFDAVQVGSVIDMNAGAQLIALDRQYVSPGLAFPQVISGKISGQLMTREYVTNDNVDRVVLCARVVSSNGLQMRGVLISSGNYGPTLEFDATATHRNKTIASGQNLSTVSGRAGDRIVIEIAYQHSTAGTSPQASAKWGTLGQLLPVNESQTTDGVGWISITPNLEFNTTTFTETDDS